MAEPRTPRSTFLVLGSLIAIGPLASELYLPALPDMARVLDTTPSLVQGTVATCLIGLALGQVIAGPVSDGRGRRGPLLAGVALFVLTSGLCALASNVWVLLALRFVQGLAGGAAVVIARAVVRDLYEGRRAALMFSRLWLVFGVAPVVAPLAGAQILQFTDWRGPFVVLAVLGVLILLGARAALPESLPPEARVTDGVRGQLRQLGGLLADRPFLGHVAISGLHGATLFTYVTMSAFVLQEEHGLSAQVYSAVLAVNAIGLVLGAQLNGALVMRQGPGRLLVAAVSGMVLATTALLVGALTGSLVAVLVPLFLAVSCVGGIGSNNMALAVAPHRSAAGSASALLGLTSFGVGAVVPPLASLMGATATVMATTMLTMSGLSLFLLLTVVRPWRKDTATAVPEREPARPLDAGRRSA